MPREEKGDVLAVKRGAALLLQIASNEKGLGVRRRVTFQGRRKSKLSLLAPTGERVGQLRSASEEERERERERERRKHDTKFPGGGERGRGGQADAQPAALGI